MKTVFRILQTILVIPLCIVAGITLGVLGCPGYIIGCVVSDIWR